MLRTNRQTNKQMEQNILPTPTDSVGVGNYIKDFVVYYSTVHIVMPQWKVHATQKRKDSQKVQICYTGSLIHSEVKRSKTKVTTKLSYKMRHNSWLDGHTVLTGCHILWCVAVARWCMVRASDWRSRVRLRVLAVQLSRKDFGQVVHIYVPHATKQYNLVLAKKHCCVLRLGR